MSKRKTKLDCVTRHTKKRLSQRYDLRFRQHELQELSNLCRKGEYVCFLEAQSLTRSKGIVEYQGYYFPVIYHKKYHKVVTVLTMDMLKPDEREKFERVLAAKGCPDAHA